MISQKTVKKVLNCLLSTGADYAEIYYQRSNVSVVSLDNGKIQEYSHVLPSGVGLRILKNTRCVYGYTNLIDEKNLIELANKLKLSFNDKQIVFVDNIKNVRIKTVSPIKENYDQYSASFKSQLLKEGNQAIKDLNDERIVRSKASFMDRRNIVDIYNSKGIHAHKDNSYGRIIFSVTTYDGKNYESGFEGPGCQKDMSFFTKDINIKEVALQAAKIGLDNLDAKECPSGVMPVVIGNGWGGVLFHEACGHSLEASAVSKNLSVFSNRLGQQIASSIVTAIDDSTMPNEWGSVDCDDEGNIGERRVLIKNGILTNYLVDELNGRRMNTAPNGACRRQNYRFAPTSRMSNTYIDNGNSTKEEIIKSVKLGLYAVSFNGGSVNPATGEFNFGCSEAYIIRNGKVCERVKGASLIGKGEEILKNIDMVGNDLKLAQGVCGAASGNIYTCVGQPTIRVSSIMVGGNGGKLK